MAADKKRCFIIMPISTPKAMEEKYSGGAEHFDHVYECLFEPSVKEAGYTPISPKAAGSQNIHANIIKNLETADLVLCDMSCLNPNVFFEWGIRTSLNKPVCIVKDELTKDVPFDTGTLHYHTYNSRLEGWGIEDQRTKLARHIEATINKSGEGNELWKHFGIKEMARPFKPADGEKSQLDYLAMQMETLQRKVDSILLPRMQDDEASVVDQLRRYKANVEERRIQRQLQAVEYAKSLGEIVGKEVHAALPAKRGGIIVVCKGPEDREYEECLEREVGKQFGMPVSVEWRDE